MIYRLIIITIIIIANSSNDYIFQYLLIVGCVMMDLTHQIIRPYSNPLLNIFDGVILHILVLVSSLPLAGFHNNIDSNLMVGMTFILAMLPSVIFIIMLLMINKENIKKLPRYCNFKCSQLQQKCYNEISLHETDLFNEDVAYVNIVDDSQRINATICDV